MFVDVYILKFMKFIPLAVHECGMQLFDGFDWILCDSGLRGHLSRILRGHLSRVLTTNVYFMSQSSVTCFPGCHNSVCLQFCHSKVL